jgi:hypothetical protein
LSGLLLPCAETIFGKEIDAALAAIPELRTKLLLVRGVLSE